MCGACDWQNCTRSHRGLFRRIWNPDLFFSTSAKMLFIVTMTMCSFSYHLSLYTFFFYLGNHSTHSTGNFFHTCTENTSLFVLGTVQKKLYTVAKKVRSPEMTSAQSTAAYPHLLHLVRFSCSINKCFHIFTFYSLSPTHKTRMNHGGRWATKPHGSLGTTRQPMYISWGIRRRIIHAARRCCFVFRDRAPEQ